MYIFEIIIKTGFFDTLLDLFKEKKESNVYSSTRKSKMQATTQYLVKWFFINRSWVFIALPNFCASHLSVKITGPISTWVPYGSASHRL